MTLEYQPPPRIPAVDVEQRPNGELVLTCPYAPMPTPANMIELFLQRAAQFPDRTLVAERDANGQWQHLCYRDAVEGCRRVAQWLLDQGASIERPLVILSPSSRQHFLMGWGAQMAGVPYCPVSLSYSTVAGAFPKLRWVLERVNPAFVFAEDLQLHQEAFDTVDPDSDLGQLLEAATVITGDGLGDTVGIDVLLDTELTDAVDTAITALTHDTVTRYIFTSGSTGMPKGVKQTHGMHCAFLGAIRAFDETPPGAEEVRVLDWMPWSHTGAGVMRLNLILFEGGSVFIDAGRPLPGQFDSTIRNLREVLPTTYSGSPLGWSVLVDALEASPELAELFFAHVTSFAFGAAAMPSALAHRIQQLAIRYKGEPVLLTTSLMSTEVSTGLLRWWPTEDHDVIGLPGPGSDIKLLPVGDNRFEIRTRSAGITPGYVNDPDVTKAAFDDEGYFRMGDAVRFADPSDPNRGLCFAGRVSEDFKLMSGTWVQAGSLRSQVLAAISPYGRDAVVCGLNETDLALLIWPNLDQCQPLAGDEHPGQSAAVRSAIATGLAAHNDSNPASSTRIARFLLLEEPPDPGAYEITDKGYVNQRAVQDSRADEVARLYAESSDTDVVVVRAVP